MAILSNSRPTNLNTNVASKVLLIDGGPGHLKLAKWRLHSDGYKIFYARDCVAGLEIFQRERAPVVLLSLCSLGEEGLSLLDKLLNMNPQAYVLVVLAKNSRNMALAARKRGAKGCLYKPFDFQELSRVVKDCFIAQEVLTHVSQTAASLEPQQTAGSPAGGQPVPQRVQLPPGGETVQLPVEGDSVTVPVRPLRRVSRKIVGQMKRNNSFLRKVLASMEQGLLILNARGQVVMMNEAMGQLAGWSPEDCRGKNFSSLPAYSPLAEKCLEVLRSVIGQENPRFFTETASLDATGQFLWYGLKASSLLGTGGDIKGFYASIDPYTQQKDFEKIIFQSEKLASVGQLAAGAAHEIRNPLTSVRGFIQLLQTELAGTPKEEYLDIIIGEIDRVNTIVNDFLNIAKPASPKREPYNMAELIREVSMLLESEAFIRQIEVHTDLVDTPLVLIDKEQMKQVLINLAQNAFEAMSNGGKLYLSLKKVKDKKVRIIVEDNGAGMDKNTLARIFEPFFTTKETGTGLGLAVAHQIMENHGGSMSVQSQPGKGTTVTLELPCESQGKN